jgi:hypothetical protein
MSDPKKTASSVGNSASPGQPPANSSSTGQQPVGKSSDPNQSANAAGSKPGAPNGQIPVAPLPGPIPIDPNEVIKNYKLKPGDYRIMVRLFEANELKTKSGSIGMKLLGGKGNTANPYVRVDIGEQSKQTKHQTGTLSPVFNEQFFFEFPKMIRPQLEETSIVFTVLDYNGHVVKDNILGTFEIDLTSVYFSLGHEVYQTSLILTDPLDEVEGTMGLLKVTIEVLGPDDEPVIHDLKAEKSKQGEAGKVLAPAKIKQSGHVVDIKIYKAEGLPVMDEMGAGIDGMVCAKYAGVSKTTHHVNSLNPEWNTNIQLGCMLPNQCKAVIFELWDYDFMTSNEMIGCWKVNFKDFQDNEVGPKWANVYGSSVFAKDGHPKDMMTLYGQDIGSHYMGRVLYSITSYDQEIPKTMVKELKFKFPDNPAPNSAQKSYLLRIDVLEAAELPIRDKAIFHFQLGPYMLKTTPKPINNGRVLIYESIADKKVLLPVNMDEIPDLIVYFADEEKDERRHCWHRIKIDKIFNIPKPLTMTVKMKEDRALDLVGEDEFPGLLFIKATLLAQHPPQRNMLDIKKVTNVKYQMRVFVYMATGLCAADEDGSADPYVIVRCAGQSTISHVKPTTLNPRWYETLVLDVELPPFEGDSEVPAGLSILVYDDDSGGKADPKHSDLIGRSWLEIEPTYSDYTVSPSEKVRIIYHKPRWYDIMYDATDEHCGKILAGYALIPADQAKKIPLEDITPATTPYKLEMFCVGIRDLNTNLGFSKPYYLSMQFDVPGDQSSNQKTDKIRLKNNGINLNTQMTINVDVPLNQTFSPLLDTYLYAHSLTSTKANLIGYVSVDLAEYLKAVYVPTAPATDHDASILRKGITADIDKKEATIKLHEVKLEDIVTKKTDDKKPTISQLPPADQKVPNAPVAVNTGSDKLQQSSINTSNNQLNNPPAPKGSDPSPVASPLNPVVPVIPEITTFKVGPNDTFGDIAEDEEDPNKALGAEVAVVNEQKPESQKKKKSLMAKHEKKAGDHQEKKEEDNGMDVIGGVANLVNRFTKETVEYEDYDTDPGEDLDVLPEWLKGREIKEESLEKSFNNNEDIKTIMLKHGQRRGHTNDGSIANPTQCDEVAFLKVVFLDGQNEETRTKQVQNYQSLMQPQNYICRIYIIEGEDIIDPLHPSDFPDTYLVVKMGEQEYKDLDRTLRLKTDDPEYYVRYDFAVEMPGAPFLRVEVWQHHEVLKDVMLGYTEIDMEERHFNQVWNAYDKKPIEKRALKQTLDRGTFGNIQLWTELINVNAPKKTAYDIAPPPKVECELRCVVWETQAVAFHDKITKCNDLYARGFVANRPDLQLETDTHWRCRAKGSFNWRMKFPYHLPMNQSKDYGMDQFKLQLWDRDILESNDMIAEVTIDLNQHKMLDKVYARRKTCGIWKKIKNKDPLRAAQTDKIWYDAYHPSVTDAKGNLKSQGKCLVSFELVPKEEVTKRENAQGRGTPNCYPVVPEPVGRFSFDILHPFNTLKELIGEGLYRKICIGICCILFIIVLIAVGYYFVPSYFAVLVGKL